MRDEICNIIARQLRIESDGITDEMDIIEELGADSLDIVEMLIAIEESLGVTVPDDDIAALKKVGEIVRYVEGSYRAKSGSDN